MINENNTNMKGKIIAYTDSVTTCDCCGKVDLKGTFCIEGENGEELYFGSVCASKVRNISIDDQKTFLRNEKKYNKLSEMEADHNGTEYSLMKMFKFVKKQGLPIRPFAIKYGELLEKWSDTELYSIGCTTVWVDAN